MTGASRIGYGILFACLVAIGAIAVSGVAPAIFSYLGDGAAAALGQGVGGQGIDPQSRVGDEQVRSMRALAGNYNLKLAFAASGTGQSLGFVKVAIQDDRGGRLIDAVSEGPLFYARLPDGLYRVVIESDGQTLVRIVNLRSGRKADLRFYWPSAQMSMDRRTRG